MGTRTFSSRSCLFVVAGAMALGTSMAADPVTATPPTDPSTTTVPAPAPTTTVPAPAPTTTLVQVQGTIQVTPEVAHAGSPYTVSGGICGIGWTITSFMVLVDNGPRIAPGPAYLPFGTIPDGVVQSATGFSFTRIASGSPIEYVSLRCDNGVTQVVVGQTNIAVFPADGSPRWRLFSTTRDPDPIYFNDVVPGTDAHVVIQSGDCQVGTPATVTFASANGTTVGASLTLLSYQGKSLVSTAEFVVPIPRTFGSPGDSFTMAFACSTATGPRTFSVAATLGTTVAPSSQHQLPGTGGTGETTRLVVLGSVLIGLGLLATRAPKRSRTR